MRILLSLLLLLNTASAGTRQIDADQVRSSDHTKTWSFPSITDTLVGLTSIAGDVPAKNAADYATTAALPTVVYANGTSGVGATLTGVALAAISVDSASPTVGKRILVKNQVSTFQNGMYTVTATGSGIAVFVLTRATDYDESAEAIAGSSMLVVSGTTYAGTVWDQNSASSPVMGTDAITFVQTAGPGSVTGGTGITVTGSSIALANMANSTIKCNVSGGSAAPADCTGQQVGTIVGAMLGTNNLSEVSSAATSRTNLGFATIGQGSILFGQATSLPTVAPELFWDNTNKRLGIGTLAPATRLHVKGTSDDQTGGIRVEAVGTTNSWSIWGSNGNIFRLHNTSLNLNLLSVDGQAHFGLGTTTTNAATLEVKSPGVGTTPAGDAGIVIEQVTSQTGRALDIYNSSAALVAKVDFAGAASVQSLTAGNFIGGVSTVAIGQSSDGKLRPASAPEVTSLLNAFTGDSGSGGVKGLVPAPSAGDAAANKFLKSDGTWSATSAGNQTVSAKTAPYTVLNTDQIMTGSVVNKSFAFALPAAAGNTGLLLNFTRIDLGANSAVYLIPNGTDKINDGASVIFVGRGEGAEIYSDGVGWRERARVIPGNWTSFTMVPNAVTTAPTKATSPGADQAEWRRVGDSIEVRYLYWHTTNTGSAAGSGTYWFPLPANCTIDTNKFTVDGASAIGSKGTVAGLAHLANTGSASTASAFKGYMIAYNTTNLTLVGGTSSSDTENPMGSGQFPLNSSALYFSFEAKVPCSGWDN